MCKHSEILNSTRHYGDIYCENVVSTMIDEGLPAASFVEAGLPIGLFYHVPGVARLAGMKVYRDELYWLINNSLSKKNNVWSRNLRQMLDKVEMTTLGVDLQLVTSGEISFDQLNFSQHGKRITLIGELNNFKSLMSEDLPQAIIDFIDGIPNHTEKLVDFKCKIMEFKFPPVARRTVSVVLRQRRELVGINW